MNLLKRWIKRRTRVFKGCDGPYLTRIDLVSNRWFTIKLHFIHRPDEDRAMHDHPWSFCTLILRGGYLEQTEHGDRRLSAGSFAYRRPCYRHRIVLVEPGTMTLVFTGRRVRMWGFWEEPRLGTVARFVPWFKYLAAKEC